MYKYQILENDRKVIIKKEEGFIISFQDIYSDNIEYQKYLAWVAEGNTAEEWKPE
jgi:hypothetical protein